MQGPLPPTIYSDGIFSALSTNLLSADVIFSTISILGTPDQINTQINQNTVVLSIADNPIIPGSEGITWPSGTTAQRAGIAGTTRFNNQTGVFEGTVDGITWTIFASNSGGGGVTSVSATLPLFSSGGNSPNISLEIVPLSYGGTNNNLIASNGGVLWSDSTKINILSGTSIANQLLMAGSSSTPSWSTNTWPTVNAQGDLIYGSALNTLSTLAKNTNAISYLANTGVNNGPNWDKVNLANGVTSVLTPANGGTGVNNGSSILTLAGSLTTSGTFTSTFVMTGNTNITFPTSGKLLADSLTNSHILIGNASNLATDIAMSGDINISNTGNTTIQSNVVNNSKLAQSNANTWKGNNTLNFGNISDNSTGTLSENVSSILTITNGLNSLLNNVSVQVTQATSLTSGYLSTSDWNTFNNKMNLVVLPVNGNILLDSNTGQAVDSGYNITTNFSGTLNSEIPTALAVQTYVNNAIVGGSSFRGQWDASVGTFPSTGGTGPNGYAASGNNWIITVAGTIGSPPVTVIPGNTIIALYTLTSLTYNISTNWFISVSNVTSVNGYTGVVSLGISDLNDVSEAGLTNGQVLIWNATSSKWVNANITATSPTTGVTVTNSAGGIALNTAQPLGTNSTPTFGSVDLTSVSGQINSNGNLFTVPQTANSTGVIASSASANKYLTGVSAGGIISSAQPSFAGLSGVSLSSLADAQILIYNNTNWVNKTLSGALTITDTGVTTVNNVATAPSISSSLFYPTFVALDTAANQTIDTSTLLSYVPSTGTLTCNVLNATTVTKSTTTVSATNIVVQLNSSSTRVQVINDIGGIAPFTETFNLPDSTTLTVGWVFEFNNNATGNITVNNFTGGLITSTLPGSYLEIILLSNVTTSGSWDYHWMLPSGVSWGTSNLTWTGTANITGSVQGSTLTDGTFSTTSGAITHATITDSSNNVAAKSLVTSTNTLVSINNTTPSAGQVLTATSGTAASWQTPSVGAVSSVSGTTAQIDVSPTTGACVVSIDPAYPGQTSLTTLGTVTTGTWNATNIALGHGGTNASLTASNGGIFYSTASAGAILAGTSTAGKMLQSGATAAPTWSTATYPSITTTNQVLYSTATNTIGGNTNLTFNGTVLGTTNIQVSNGLSEWYAGQKLIGSGNIGTSAQGQSVSLSGIYAAIGGPGDNSIGAVWIYMYSSTSGLWAQTAKIVPLDNIGNSQFGNAVSLTVVGTTLTLAIGGVDDNNGIGAAWIYQNTGGGWFEAQKLIPPLTGGNAYIGTPNFGSSISLLNNGSTYIVAIGGTTDGTATIGAAWIYQSTTGGGVGSWGIVTKIVPLSSGPYPYIGTNVGFGYAVSLINSGSTYTVMIGGPVDNSIGAVWVYQNSSWTTALAKIIPPSTGPYAYFGTPDFGCSISVVINGSTYTAAIGGLYDHNYVGAAWIYQNTTSGTGTWSVNTKIAPTDYIATPGFGFSVSMNNTGSTYTAAIGSFINGIGAAWIYQNTAGAIGPWSEINKLIPVNNSSGIIIFGCSVSLNNTTVLIGGLNDNNSIGASWIYNYESELITQGSGNIILPGTVTAGTFSDSAGTNISGGAISTTNLISNNSITCSGTTIAASSTTGTLVSYGGVGIAENLWIGSAFTDTNTSVAGSILNIPSFTYTSSTSSPTQINIVSVNSITLNGTGTVGSAASLYIDGAPVAGTLSVTNPYSLQIATGISAFQDTTASSSSSSGNIVTAGGIGISNSTDASNFTNGGSFTTAGGAAIAKSLYVGTVINGVGTTATTSPNSGALLLAGGLGINNATDAVSTFSGGSFTTAGGAAIGQSLWVGTNETLTGTSSILSLTGNSSQISTQSNLDNYFLSLPVNYLVVAGGGGGGDSSGGGAGGMLTGSITLGAVTAYSITIGAGGAGGIYPGNGNWIEPFSGNNSSIGSVVIAIGGGAGSGQTVQARNGGSGGGAGSNSAVALGTVGQGHNGGTTSTYNAGAGGGAGAVGGNSTNPGIGATGGAGLSSSISGVLVYYAGGGGSTGYGAVATPGQGGIGGGGIGSSGDVGWGNLTLPTSGTAGTGGGGGGAQSGYPITSGSGGSGIVIISYTGTSPLASGGVITYSGGQVIHTFTTNGTFTTGTYSSSIVTTGGIGIAESLYVGTNAMILGTLYGSTFGATGGQTGIVVQQTLHGYGNPIWSNFGNSGLQIGWNNVSGSGGTDFLTNSQGGGGPYFTFWYTNNSHTTPISIGQIASNGTYSPISDYRLKDNVVNLDPSVYNVDKLRPVSYTMKLSGESDLGLIAHEVQEIYPNLVSGTKDGEHNQTLNYTGIIPILISEIQQLKAQIKKLTSLSQI